MTSNITYDFIAIGLGPFNLSLACLSEPISGLNCLFLEKKPGFSWHQGMLLDDTTLQNPFLADMVTMADPTSQFSYLNYCKQQGRLYTYYIRENWYLTRQEFNRYCQWAANQLSTVRFLHDVQDITFDNDTHTYTVAGVRSADGAGFQFTTRKLVIGIGGKPHIPESCHYEPGHTPPIHSCEYLSYKSQLQRCKNVTVIGSGQSGAEIYQDLLQDSENHGYTLNWVSRAPRFFQMENARLTLELITPDYGNYFFDLSDSEKARTLEDQRSIYNGINQSLIAKIYDTLDERTHRDAPRTQQLTNLALTNTRRLPDGSWDLEFEHVQTRERYRHSTDGLVFATGFRYQIPHFTTGIRDRIRWDDQGRYIPSRNWAVDHRDEEIFVQNVGFQSHGLTNPDLGLACHRNSRLLAALTGVDHYPAETRTAYQDFIPTSESGFDAISRQANF